MSTVEQADMMAQMLARVERERPIIERLVAEGVHPITAHVMAGDLLSVEDARDDIRARRARPVQAMNRVGSFGRWQFAFDLWREGQITASQFFAGIADRWSSSDPDDGVHWLPVWREARFRNDRKYVRDGGPIPSRKTVLKVYRGEPIEGDTPGIAWTLDFETAKKFALGAGARVPFKQGTVLVGWAQRADVLAYITGRGESEVILDPARVTIVDRQRVSR